MSDYLGSTYKSGDPAPEKGTYQLANDDPHADARTIMGRVVRLDQGDPVPPHPDTGGPAEWRFVRVDQMRRGEPLHHEF